MTLERTYIVPLRKDWLKAPKYRRAKRAVSSLKTFLSRHMKSEDIRLGTSVNLELWKHGIKNPPSRVKITVVKDDKGVVRAELFGVPVKQEKKTEEKKGVVKKIAEKVTGAKTETPAPKPQAPAKTETAQAPKPTSEKKAPAPKKTVKTEAPQATFAATAK